MKYAIVYPDGTPSRNVESEERALEILSESYPDLVICENGWEPSNFDGTVERLLIWSDEASSLGDGGENAVAQIERAATRLTRVCDRC